MPVPDGVDPVVYWMSRSIQERMDEMHRLTIEQAKKVGLYDPNYDLRKQTWKKLTREEWIKSEEESYKRFNGLE